MSKILITFIIIFKYIHSYEFVIIRQVHRDNHTNNDNTYPLLVINFTFLLYFVRCFLFSSFVRYKSEFVFYNEKSAKKGLEKMLEKRVLQRKANETFIF